MKKNITIEICCNSLEDCFTAQNCGAHRIELISAHQLGGLTPTIGTVRSILNNISIPIEAIVRPRMSGFHYTPYEFEAMCIDAKELLLSGVDGIVFGFLNKDSTLDYERTARFIEIIGESNTCFHRAIDITKNQDDAIEKLISLGVKRILTSGNETSSYSGMDHIKYLNDTYGNKIDIMVGGGITSDNIHEILYKTQVSQVHFSGTTYEVDTSAINSNNIAFGALHVPPNECYIKVNEEKVKKIISSIEHSIH